MYHILAVLVHRIYQVGQECCPQDLGRQTVLLSLPIELYRSGQRLGGGVQLLVFFGGAGFHLALRQHRILYMLCVGVNKDGGHHRIVIVALVTFFAAEGARKGLP